jgi:hypothetical protein
MGESDLERDPHTVPIKVRHAVIERDNSSCRVCGQYVEYPALHHIEYRSEGGRNTESNLIVVGWLPGHDCHLTVAHANKKLWQPILMEIAERPNVTALAAYRWKYGSSFRLPHLGRSR